jgi:two-component system chemotaxis response regulator CheB
MPVGYTALFAEKLAELSQLRVLEAFEGCEVQPGLALLAPAGRHLSFRRSPDGSVKVALSVQPMDKPHRPSVDVLFQSAAEVYRKRVLGVVMTGMGDDGKQGAAWIKAQGGFILTESEESCIIYGMPRSVVESGFSDGAVPLHCMAQEINNRL